jgi:hypothetical protein
VTYVRFPNRGCRGRSAVITGSLGLVEAQDPERELIERALGRPPAIEAGIPLPQVREFSLDNDPPWVIYDVLPGVLAVRLADPLFDPAWRAWSVSFSGPGVLETAWPPFLAGAGIDPAEPRLGERVHALQVLRMMEQLASGNLTPSIADIVTDRLHAALT